MRSGIPVIAVTAGDPNGVGPEVAVKAVLYGRLENTARCVIVGRPQDVEQAAALCGADVRPKVVGPEEARAEAGRGLVVVPAGVNVTARAVYGRPTKESGSTAVASVELAVRLALDGIVDAMATAPISKEAIRLAGCPFAGHTELLAHLTGAQDVRMLLVAGELRVVHNSTHVSLREACDLVRRDRVLTTIRLAHRAATAFGLDPPTLGVAGLNPHAGEGGLFGREDADEIAPAVNAARQDGILAEGPLPPDSVFARAMAGGFAVVVAMYHDQGHIPVKTLGFRLSGPPAGGAEAASVSGVNVTLGLPIVRTSVDHGTAYDLAGKGVASAQSMEEAIALAARLALTRPAKRW
ncbi:MAG: 4-hydroxythreonine-4-phosphate dehydrogenase PdxA [Armatimonadota bacterium]